ncbi:tRNA (guanosine(37)-N1)-methyltransferase TrmD [uncultured Desulfobulbus sp.]|uniref:tRNA (guanosine(37)-N1)-methyltransferase TrmD n=1 Tax=uncultured Desulfobulbus sp. TaxID=239745 RepID=UPI0029C99612|nr:tRNA (guanosine(37)-N1)-methyltransferase TrmD [uncultured Desulfobulbus sp.]
MIFSVLTIFPDFFVSPLQEGIVRRALNEGKIQVGIYNIRDYALDRHHMTDDRPFGGGEGMVMKPEPLAACLKAVSREECSSRVILLSPKGERFSQQQAQRLARYDHLAFICGRYEGVDERFRHKYVDEELSIGDYVLTGGELAALVVVDAVCRLLPGVLGCEASALNDSFSCGLLKHGQYTRPRIFEGAAVPDVLLSGDHAAIDRFRLVESVRLTLERRPELLAATQFTPAEKKILKREGLYSRIETIVKENRESRSSG